MQRTMTKDEAKAYISAGFFPDPRSILEICDLQDVFGHLPYDFNVGLLIDESTRGNAARLFDLIWDSITVSSMEREVRRVLETRRFQQELEEELKRVNEELAEINITVSTDRARYAI